MEEAQEELPDVDIDEVVSQYASVTVSQDVPVDDIADVPSIDVNTDVAVAQDSVDVKDLDNMDFDELTSELGSATSNLDNLNSFDSEAQSNLSGIDSLLSTVSSSNKSKSGTISFITKRD